MYISRVLTGICSAGPKRYCRGVRQAARASLREKSMSEQKTEVAGVYRLDDGRYRIKVYVMDPETGKQKKYIKTLQQGVTLRDATVARAALEEERKQVLRHRETRCSEPSES